MTLVVMNPFLSFSIDGRREALFRFYQCTLDGKIKFMLTRGEAPVAD